MKLKSFRITNYKSIVDSGECRLSDNDNITVLAGQNESGKSSILQALRDYEKGEINADSLRDDGSMPSISCTYNVDKDFVDDKLFEDIEVTDSIRKLIIELKELKIIKSLDTEGSLTISLDEELKAQITKLLEKDNEEIDKRNENAKSTEPGKEEEHHWDLKETLDEIVNELVSYTPNIIFFDDFCDLLPDQILISDIKLKNKDAKGLQAVKNVETILGADFTRLDDLSDGRRETTQTTYHEAITADFNEKWKQRIAEGNGAKVHVKHYRNTTGTSYLKFYIETKKGEFLSVEKRSQGFKWFLSFYLQLKAEDKRTDHLIILFDEPGMYLHSKAQLDMIKVFEELSSKNQIIYSTHSPYLIDTAKLHRLRLVLNTKETGTTIEKITSNKINNQKDALKPIIDALGLEVASPFSVAKKNNVILEGISDFHYMQSMKLLLSKNIEVGLLPSMGSSNSHLLMEICMGWGLNWIIVFDDKGAVKDYNKIKKQFFNDSEEETQKRIFRLKDCDGIEDMFTVGDMKLVDTQAQFSADKKNSEVVSQHGGKELYARLFYEKALKGDITKEKISVTAIKNFEKIFSFIDTAFEIES
jgi:predicted ATP-dependent endonuclease of OLD family